MLLLSAYKSRVSSAPLGLSVHRSPLSPKTISSSPFIIIMDFLYVPTQYSSDIYSSFVDSETANNVPGLSHSSDSSSRCSTPKSFDRPWDADTTAATIVDGPMWDPLSSFNDRLDMVTPPAPHDAQQNALGLFGGRSGPHCIPHGQPSGPSFDALMRGLEQQQPYAEVFSYKPAYEPLNWTLPSADSCWPELASTSSASVSAPRPLRAEFNNDVLRSLDTCVFPTDDTTAYHHSEAARHHHSHSASSVRYNPLAIRRGSAPKGSASRLYPASSGSPYPQQLHHQQQPTQQQQHQHQCSACPCKFARARDLTRHFRLHTGERPYECAGCNERFIRVDARKRHWNNRPACHAAHQTLTS